MKRMMPLSGACLIAISVAMAAAPQYVCAQLPKQKSTAAAVPDYARDIRPLLQARCVVCHNSELVASTATSGGLDLGSVTAIRRGVVLKDGARSILSPTGKNGISALLERLASTSPTRLMPKGGPPLEPEQISLFKHWIAAGTPSLSGKNVEPAAPVAKPASELPMPSPSGVQEVTFPTLIKPAPDMYTIAPGKTNTAPVALSLALKVGPVAAVTALAFSPDGSLLAVGGYRAVALWNTKTGLPLAGINHLAGQVQALAFKPDGTQIAIGGGLPGTPCEVRIVDLQTLRDAGPHLKGSAEAVLSIAWSADGKSLATGSQDRTARVWDVATGKELKSFKEHGDAVTRVCFSPDGKSLYTACLDHNLRRYDLVKGALLTTYSGHSDGVNALAVSLDGKRIISAGVEPNLRWWNADTGDLTNNIGGHGAQVTEIAISRDGKTLASASADKSVRVWDAIGTGQQRSLAGATDWEYAVAISPDSKFTAAGGADGMVRLWETANGRLRLLLLSWPLEKSPTPEWLAVTPEGYCNGSPGWLALLKPASPAGATPTARVVMFVQGLRQPESVAKAWQGLALNAAKP